MQLSRECYNPVIWLNRAYHLLLLGYPELAAGDAHKADMLVTAKLKSIDNEKSVDESIELADLKLICLTRLAEALAAIWESVGLNEVCRDGLAIRPSHPELNHFSKLAAEILEAKRRMAKNQNYDGEMQKLFVSQGIILHEQYPFMSTKHMRRDNKAIDAVKQTLQVVSSNCSLAPRTFSGPSRTQTEGFGIYAKTNIEANTRLFDDETILGALNADTSSPSATKGVKGPEICGNCWGCLPINSTLRVKSPCCSTVYCSEHCRDLASRFYHSKTCGQDFKWLYGMLQAAREDDPAMNVLMLLRLLSICTQHDCHPLDHPLIARLIPHLSDAQSRKWTFRDNIVNPNLVLQQLGVDIFQDLRFDTWVLQNVRYRMVTNQRGTAGRRFLRAINPLYCFLNHSCEPNAIWYAARASEGATAHDSTTISVISTKPIKKGEEICIDYNKVSRISNKAKRQEELRNWIPGGVCACTRCQREV